MANQEIVPAHPIEEVSFSASNSYQPCYDVFINHRGPDVKDTFATHLYRQLLDLGLQVFLDREELVEGQSFPSQIEAAIRVASVHVAIFSPTYAQSEWCLKELVLMLNSGATILPVFYHVQPSLLRRTKGAYGEALQNLQQKTTRDPQTRELKPRYDTDTIISWRNALSRVADISGFELHGDEGEILVKVVQAVLNKVPKTPFYVAKHPVGLAEKLQEFERTVVSEQQELKTSRACGVGKTTLAKHLFNIKRSDYYASSFLENARTMPLNDLQSKLIADLKPELKHYKNIKIESPDQGIGILKKRLSSCHALVILDDVDHLYQMEALVDPIKDILSPGSLILVTSRDKHLLRSSAVSWVYDLKGLNRPDSKQLFCSYAFRKHHPLPEFADLIDRFVAACDGLPLSLKIFGALVCKQKESYWEEILDRLHKRLPKDIQERLRISYDSLDEEDQPIFLDIVCFSTGEGMEKARRIWGMVGLQHLEDKCLLDADNENKLKLHDHIRDMGRVIAKERSMPCRLYRIDDFLEQPSSSDITEVRGISMVARGENFGYDEYLSWPEWPGYKQWRQRVLGNRKFNKYPYHGTNFKVLSTEDGYLKAILSRVRSPHLIWVRWYKCPYSCLPSWVPMKNLRVLEVSGIRLKRSKLTREQSSLPCRNPAI